MEAPKIAIATVLCILPKYFSYCSNCDDAVSESGLTSVYYTLLLRWILQYKQSSKITQWVGMLGLQALLSLCPQSGVKP
ncbi:MAG: hypothetical protein KME25_28225 [Symplocastrum torsivum CPER-KK1]|uniref:Uncharacterized protein n=1 Tax=Symplocastrum torsivum CPER-KK1 TaxID=450513 RepID=A0A951UCJ2_9CYAN|nr:hypothetical protein [Symplocastrum torsivum CPER-KK1]